MEKHLVTIEFRYTIGPKSEEDMKEHKNKTITLGIYDSLDEAIENGNKQVEIFEKHFKLNPNWNRRDRFSKNGDAFGMPKKLISPLGYLECPFDFYAKITTLTFASTEETILNILKQITNENNTNNIINSYSRNRIN